MLGVVIVAGLVAGVVVLWAAGVGVGAGTSAGVGAGLAAAASVSVTPASVWVTAASVEETF